MNFEINNLSSLKLEFFCRRQVYGALTQEFPCSESISSWLKLLPCGNSAGLASFLRPDNIVKAPLHALSLRIDAVEDEDPSSFSTTDIEKAIPGVDNTATLSSSDKPWKGKLRLSLGVTLLQKAADRSSWMEATDVQSALEAALGRKSSSNRDQKNNKTIPACPASTSSAVLLPRLTSQGRKEGKSDDSGKNTFAPSCCASVKNSKIRNLEGDAMLQVCHFQGTSSVQNAASNSLTSSSEKISSCGFRTLLCFVNDDDNERKKVLSHLGVSSWMVPKSPQISQLSISIAVDVANQQIAKTDATETKSTLSSKSPAPLLHIFQAVPWEVAVRWHTLKLSVNTHPISLITSTTSQEIKKTTLSFPRSPSVVWKNLQRAQPRKHAAVIELLLALPMIPLEETTSYHVTLKVEIAKELLTVFDYPPEASRGIDIPAAMVALVQPLSVQPKLNNSAITNPSSLNSSITNPPSSTPSTPSTAPASKLPKTDSINSFFLSTRSLISRSLGCGSVLPTRGDGEESTVAADEILVLHRRGSPHLLNLPIPDASMPFNVVCFTSTAIAVTFGSVLNALLKAPGAGSGIGDEGGARRAIKMRLLRLVIVLILVGATAVYMDKDLQRKVDEWLSWMKNISLPIAAGGRAEL